MKVSVEWFEQALPRYFVGDLDRVEQSRFDQALDDQRCQKRFDEAWDERAKAKGALVLEPGSPSLADCFSFETLEEYAAGSLRRAEAETVRAHLGCSLCGRQVEALHAEVRPGVLASIVAWWVALLSRWKAGMWIAAPMVAAAAILFAVVQPDYRAKGPGGLTLDQAVDATFLVGDRPLVSGDEIDAEARVRLRYTNALPKERPVYMSAFAIDEKGSVFWFFPAWTNPDDNPRAVLLDADAKQVMFDEEVSHDLRHGKLRFVAVFSTKRNSVRDIEKRLRPSSPAELLRRHRLGAVDDGVERSITVLVR